MRFEGLLCLNKKVHHFIIGDIRKCILVHHFIIGDIMKCYKNTNLPHKKETWIIISRPRKANSNPSPFIIFVCIYLDIFLSIYVYYRDFDEFQK